MFIGGPITTEAAVVFGSRHDGVGLAVPGVFMIVTTNR
jgi:hypothetical protein